MVEVIVYGLSYDCFCPDLFLLVFHLFVELVESRRSAMTETDHKMMQLFSGTREPERTRMPERPVLPEVRRVIQKMLFGIFIILLVSVFVGVLLNCLLVCYLFVAITI